jgi:hypothetical protein
MSTTQAARGQVLAEFVQNVDEGAGWWFRAPKDPNSSNVLKNDNLHPDGIMPQLGALFFLEESAMLAMLHQMGCYEMKGKAFIFSKKGWDNLASEFRIAPTSWEIATCRLGPVTAVTHYIKIGNISTSPKDIYKNYRDEPKVYQTPSVSTRQSKNLVARSMIQSLRNSGVFTSMLEIYAKITDPNKIMQAAGVLTKTLADEEKAEEDEEIEDDDDDDNNDDDDGEDDGVEDGGDEVLNAANFQVDDFSKGMPAGTLYPVMQHFGVPKDNENTLIRLHCEVTKALRECQNVSKQSTGEMATSAGTFSDAIVYKDPVSNRRYTYIMVPKGRNNSTILKLKRTIAAMSDYCIEPKGKEDKEAQGCIRQVIGELEKSYPAAYLEVCKLKGYSTSQAGKMSALYWHAMCEEGNLHVTQQRVINRYLTHHLGVSVRVSENELRKQANEYVPFVSFEKVVENKKVKYIYRDLSALFSFYAEHLLEYFNTRPVDKIEVSVGGDHGKGVFSFVAIVVIRYKGYSDPFSFTLQLGEIDSPTDSMEHLTPLIEKINPGLLKMQPDENANCNFVLIKEVDKKHTVAFGPTVSILTSKTRTIVRQEKLELWMAGDFKFLFMMFGRDGMCGAHCFYCRLKQSEWVKLHAEKESIYCDADAWTVAEIIETAKQANLAGTGVKGLPLMPFIPIYRVVLPILHELIGLGNDLIKSFWLFVEERVEVLLPAERIARNRTIMLEIGMDVAKVEIAKALEDMQGFVARRQDLTVRIKTTIGNSEVQKAARHDLSKEKEQVKALENAARSKRIAEETKLKSRRASKNAAKATETAVRKLRSRKDKALPNLIESDVFNPNNVTISSYHGGDLEGNSIRQLMAQGKDIMKAAADLLVLHRDEDSAGEVEIRATCDMFGTMYQLLDSIFSILHTKHGQVTDGLLLKLETLLEAARKAWKHLGMSETPKWHMLLCHAVSLLRESKGGLVDKGETHIEKHHQTRHKDHQRTCRQRNSTMQKASQAKFENFRLSSEIKKEQARVAIGSQRKLKRGTESLKEEKDSIKKEGRESKRLAVEDEEAANPMVKRVPPRDLCKEELKAKIREDDAA